MQAEWGPPRLAGQLVALLSLAAPAWLPLHSQLPAWGQRLWLPAWVGPLGLAAEGSPCHPARTTQLIIPENGKLLVGYKAWYDTHTCL